jgi:hypothetical protein
MSSICMSWLGVEASFGSGATTGLEPVNSLLSTVSLENSERAEPKGIILLRQSCPFSFDPTSLVALLILLRSFIRSLVDPNWKTWLGAIKSACFNAR